ncbi:MAG: cation:proton antiporter [archaeon]
MLEQELMNLGLLFFFAIIGGIIAVKLKQPAVIGLLLVGIIIGPNFLNFIKDPLIIESMAELGTILLLFVIGLEFVIPKLMKIGSKAILIGVLKLGIVSFLTFEIFVLMGFSQAVALVFGVMLSISSTVVIVKVLEAKGMYEREEMMPLIGVLIIEDIFAVIVLTYLSTATTNPNIFIVLEKIVFALGTLLIAYLIMLKVSKLLIPFLIKQGNEDITTFIALGICAGFSFLAFKLGLQPATGAFLAGSVVASLSEVRKFEYAIKPYTLTFSSLFFIAIGTMVDLSIIKENFWLLMGLVILVIITRFIAVGVVSYLFASFKRQQMVFSSIAMIPVGEFSLLIGQSAMKLNLGVDFVSIVAFLIFFTAVIMSLIVSYHKQVTDFVITSSQSEYQKPRTFSYFMRNLLSDLDTDNSNTKQFKNLFMHFSLSIIMMFFTLIIWNRIRFNATITSSIIYLVSFIAVELLLVVISYVKGKKLFHITSQIISNTYCMPNDRRANIVLRDMVLAISFLLITIYSPVLIVLFKMPEWINILSFALLILMILRFRRLFSIIHRTVYHKDSFKYRKMSKMGVSVYDS